MTIYDEIEKRRNALKNIKQNTEDLEPIQEINGIISQLTVVLNSLEDKIQSLNENLQGGTNNINAHLQLDNNVIYSKACSNVFIQNIIDQAEKIIRDAELTQNNKKRI